MACSEVVWLQDAKHIKDNEIYNSNQDQSTENLRSLIQPNSVSTRKRHAFVIMSMLVSMSGGTSALPILLSPSHSPFRLVSFE